jgi:hypothetical protein
MCGMRNLYGVAGKRQAAQVQRVPDSPLLWEGVPGRGLADAQACMQALAGGTLVTACYVMFVCKG